MIRLELVNERTFKKVIDMKLSDEQNRFVAPNVVSLAQAWLCYEEAKPYAICDDDEVVGFVMLDWDEGERTVGIWRFMIASEHQKKGYGKSALEAVIDLVRNSGCFDLIHLDYVEGNTIARNLYYSLGFRENGDIEEGEIIMTLPLTDQPQLGMLTADMDDLDDFLELVEAEQSKGSQVPTVFESKLSIEQAIQDQRVKRFTIMGKTIGLAIDQTILMETENHKWYEEAQEKIKA